MGEVEKYKAQLIAKDFSQNYGVDYKEIFSHMKKMLTIRLTIASFASFSWKIFQLDVKGAFLNSNLDVKIYMEQSQGFISVKLLMSNEATPEQIVAILG